MLTYLADTAPTSTPDLIGYFFDKGILGVIIIVLGIVLVKIYNSREKERIAHALEIATIQKEKEAIMEARRLDAVEARSETNSVLPGISQSLQYIGGKIESVQPKRNR